MIADIGYQYLRFIDEPLLISEKQKYDDHRSAKEVVIEILFQEAGFRQQLESQSIVSFRREIIV